MTVEGGVRIAAGVVVLVTVGMSHPSCPLYVSHNLLLVTTFVGVMLVQSPFTGFCPSAWVLKKLGLKSGSGTSADPAA